MSFNTESIRRDPAMAWAYHCCVAMILIDNGIDEEKANSDAAYFMLKMFGVDTTKNENYSRTFLPMEDIRMFTLYHEESPHFSKTLSIRLDFKDSPPLIEFLLIKNGELISGWNAPCFKEAKKTFDDLRPGS